MKIRMRFEKTGSVRYVGHLDIMRYFHKVLQRAHVDVSFSSGYHPHPIMSFASPLGVGLTSQGEYVDFEVRSTGSSEEMLRRINAAMVPEIRATGYRRLPDTGKGNKAMALVGMADYRVKIREENLRTPVSDTPDEKIADYLALDEIIVPKKGKKGISNVNIRPWIREFRYEPETDSFFMRLSAGSLNNLKPELLMHSFLAFCGGTPPEPEGETGSSLRSGFDICRLDLYTAEGVSLGDLGEEITEESLHG